MYKIHFYTSSITKPPKKPLLWCNCIKRKAKASWRSSERFIYVWITSCAHGVKLQTCYELENWPAIILPNCGCYKNHVPIFVDTIGNIFVKCTQVTWQNKIRHQSLSLIKGLLNLGELKILRGMYNPIYVF